MNERRSHYRLFCSDLAVLSWRDNSGADLKELANVENVSSTGVCLVISHSIPLGTHVEISGGGERVIGIVGHHAEQAAGHLLGIEIIGEFHLSMVNIQPELRN